MMINSDVRRLRHGAITAAAACALLAVGACSSINDAFDGINPISRTLDKSAKKSTASGGYRQPLAIPPDYSLKPPAGKAESRQVRETETKAKTGEGQAKIKVTDPKKIDLGASSSSEKVSSQTLGSSGRIVREGRVETRGREMVKDGSRSKGEDELLKRSGKN